MASWAQQNAEFWQGGNTRIYFQVAAHMVALLYWQQQVSVADFSQLIFIESIQV